MKFRGGTEVSWWSAWRATYGAQLFMVLLFFNLRDDTFVHALLNAVLWTGIIVLLVEEVGDL